MCLGARHSLGMDIAASGHVVLRWVKSVKITAKFTSISSHSGNFDHVNEALAAVVSRNTVVRDFRILEDYLHGPIDPLSVGM